MPSDGLILVVDDDAVERAFLRSGFEEAGFKVVEAHDEEGALAAVFNKPIQLVTLDLEAGHKIRIGLARKIKSIRNVPVIIVTADGAPHERAESLEHGADDYIVKPFDIREALIRARLALERYAPLAQDDASTTRYSFDSSVLDTKARILRHGVGNLSLRKMLANALRALLLFIGLMFALSAAGIDLTALGVLGGAIGVGIGFGLQKLASNYVSGFVILAENSLRIGDIVTVDGFEGRITDIKVRYTVIRALSGRESIVPNEMMITQRVENASLADRNIVLSTVVQVGYGTDVEPLMAEVSRLVGAVPRVLAEPPVGVRLSNFAADGLELTVNFWIGDPENGSANVRSDVNLALLRLLNARGVEIPFPQRVVRQLAPD